MHAYLIVGGGDESIENKVKEIAEKNAARVLEFPLSKISDVRELERFTSRSREKTIIVSKNIDQSSLESLNAFLKNLEEPNPNISYVLTVSNINNILPTVVSRCEVIKLVSGDYEINNEILVKKFLKGNSGERFLIIDRIKKKEEALIFIKDLITYLHLNLKKTKDEHFYYAQVLKAVQKTFNAINSNGNVGLQLTNLVVILDNLSGKSFK